MAPLQIGGGGYRGWDRDFSYPSYAKKESKLSTLKMVVSVVITILLLVAIWYFW